MILLLLLLWFPFSLLYAQIYEASDILEMNQEGVISFVTYGENKEEIAKGTGFMIGESLMITAYHLVSEIASAEGKNYKGKKVKIEGIVSVDKNFDIALLKIKGKRKVLNIGDSIGLESGKKVFAIGSSSAQEIIVSDGVVRDFLQLSPTHRIVTTSLAVPETFCGGPLLDSVGSVMGMIVFLDRGSKFILPSNVLNTLSTRGKETKFKNWKHEDYFSILEGADLAGRIFALMDETGKARRFLEKVTKLNPQNIEAYALLSSVYTKDRNYQSAISAFKKVIELDESRYQAHYGLGLVYLRTRKLKEGISSLEKATQLNPNHKDAYYYLGNAHEELKDFAKAAEAYERFISLNPEEPWSGYLRLGLSRMELTEFDKAIAALQKALEEKPQDIKTNYNLAQAYQKAGQLEKAEVAYETLSQLNPQDANVYYSTILRMYDEAGMQDKAIEAAKKLIELNPKNEINAYNLGIMYMKLERFDEAIQTFQDVLAIRPDYAYAYYNIGVCYSRQKKQNESINAFTKFVELDPENADGWFNIGVGYMILKQFTKALKPLEKAVELRSNYGVALYNLAITYLNLKDNYSAREVYNKLNTIDPNLAQKLKKHIR